MNDKNPLKLPVGSVRAIIALIMVIAMVVAMFVKVEIPEVIFGFIGAVIGFYFAHRANNSESH